MNEDFIVIKPRIGRSQRFEGLFLLGLVLSVSILIVWALVDLIRTPNVEFDESPGFVFSCAVLCCCLGAVGIWGVRLAFESQTWIAGRDHFECRSEMLGMKWSKIYRATAWKFERLNTEGRILYALRPVDSHPMLMPIYRTFEGRECLEMGRQLALATGWPVHLPSNIERLEKEFQL